MRYSPLRKVGRRGLEISRTRANVWPQVLRRAGGKCEGCGARAENVGGVEWHHTMGRPGSGLCLGPFADSVELTCCLCRACHSAVDQGLDLALRTQLRWQAYWRLSQRLQLAEGPAATPEDAVRALIRAADSMGLAPEGM